ncbi:MAG: cation:proton antiporter [Prevotella sp.]|nr:cation:proton antiporter [Prevotella sp.]
MHDFFSLPITNPTLIFFVVLLVILLSPIIMGKLRIPHIIGFVLFGVLIGPAGIGLLARDDSFELFGRVGLYYIMFLAALEMDLQGLRQNIGRMAVFALLTFAVPFVLTLFMGRKMLNYTWLASLLLCCIMSANTLISYPIVTRFGLQRKTSVVLSVGSSMISLLLSLITLAAVVGAHTGESNAAFWLLFALKFVLFCAGLIFIVPIITRWFIRNYSDAVMQFIFMLAVLFLSASLSERIGLEGISGAFLAGLVLNHYIPRVSPLMNRLEFTGNALFIPYFLIGVGMLINIRLLFSGGNILWTVFLIVVFGTLGKATAAYLSSFLFRLPLSAGNMMFGLTSAHAAGAIAIVMVGMRITDSNGRAFIGDDMLNGVVIMILVTCIISTLITQGAAEQITIRDQEIPKLDPSSDDEEKILVPVRYPEYATRLISLALMMRNNRLHNPIVALNLVYDDSNTAQNYERGVKLLDKVSKYAAGSDVPVETQVRVAENIANGIKHAFREFRATEIIIGTHIHKERSRSFWGDFHQSLFNGLNRQITMAYLMQPLSMITSIVVAVPSKAQFEPGFYRWNERLCRLSENIGARLVIHGRNDTVALMRQYIENRHANLYPDYVEMEHWSSFPALAATIGDDTLFVIISARQGTFSYKNAQEKLPDEMTNSFKGKNFLIVFPDQHGDLMEEMTFAQSQHTEGKSAYDSLRDFILRRILRKKQLH